MGGWSHGSKSHYSSQYGGTRLKRDVPRFTKLIEKGLFDAKAITTATYPLDKLIDAMRVAGSKRPR